MYFRGNCLFFVELCLLAAATVPGLNRAGMYDATAACAKPHSCACEAGRLDDCFGWL